LKKWPPTVDYGVFYPPGRIKDPTLFGKPAKGAAGAIIFGHNGAFQFAPEKPPNPDKIPQRPRQGGPLAPRYGENAIICPLIPGRILYFTPGERGFYLGGTGPNGKGGYNPPSGTPFQKVTLTSGMQLPFEGGGSDTGQEVGAFRGLGYKPKIPGQIITVVTVP
jgi:hypothetical protein